MRKGIYRVIVGAALACLLTLATVAAISAQHRGGPGGDPAQRAGGKVTVVGSTSITVQGRDDNSTVIQVTADTKIERNGQAATLADFKAGDFAFAHGARDAAGQFVADRLMGGDRRPQGRGPGEGRGGGVFGELQGVDTTAHTLTVKLPDGSTQTIYTSENTRFNRNRQEAQLSDFKAGDHVRANGALNEDGRFIAERVFGGDQPPPRRNQQ